MGVPGEGMQLCCRRLKQTNAGGGCNLGVADSPSLASHLRPDQESSPLGCQLPQQAHVAHGVGDWPLVAHCGSAARMHP